MNDKEKKNILKQCVKFYSSSDISEIEPLCYLDYYLSKQDTFVHDVVELIENGMFNRLRSYGNTNNLTNFMKDYLSIAYEYYHAKSFDFFKIYENGIFLVRIDNHTTKLCGKSICFDIHDVREREIAGRYSTKVDYDFCKLLPAMILFFTFFAFILAIILFPINYS